MAKAPAFQMYAQDFDMDTATWDNYELGMYIRILNYAWINGGVPSDAEGLSKICRCSIKKFNHNCKNLLTKFTQNGDGFLHNKRQEEEREKQDKYRKLQSQRGKISAEKRWGDITTVITPVTSRLQPDCNSSSSSSSLIQKKNIKKKVTDDEFLTQVKETYSWVDYNLEIKKMDLWLTNNQQRKKTRRFILNWFGRKEKPLSINQPSKTQIEGGRVIKNSYDCLNCHKNFTDYEKYLTHDCKPEEVRE
jgi:uncharacterized protein YdaU (DUF1376 family)